MRPKRFTGLVTLLGQVIVWEEHCAGVSCGSSEKVKSYRKLVVRQEVLSDDPTVSVGVVPPEPKPVASYMVTTNSKPAG